MRTSSRSRSSESGLTLVEIVVALAVLAVLGTLISSFTLSETWLFAKNTSLNTSHTSLRSGLDRLTNALQQTQSLPSLINNDGTVATTSPAAGLQYDYLVGGPYVLNGTSYSAGDTTISITRSTNTFVVDPLPQQGDVLLIDTPTDGTVRAQVSSASSVFLDLINKRQVLDITLTTPLANDINWTPPKTAQLVRRQAFIVRPVVRSKGPRNELRFYPSFEPVPANLDDPTSYALITEDVSDAQPQDATPFFLDATTGDKLTKASLRIRSQDYVNSLANKQSNAFNTFVRIDVTLPSRMRPKS